MTEYLVSTLPYSREIWQGIKFGSLVVYLCNCHIKIHQYFILAYIRMAIPYRTAKGPTTKYNSHQYFQLHSILLQTHLLQSVDPLVLVWLRILMCCHGNRDTAVC